MFKDRRGKFLFRLFLDIEIVLLILLQMLSLHNLTLPLKYGKIHLIGGREWRDTMKKFFKILLIVSITIVLILVAFILFNSLDPLFLKKNNALSSHEINELIKSYSISGDEYFNHYQFLGSTRQKGNDILVIKMVNTNDNVIVIKYVNQDTGVIVKELKNNGIFNTYVEEK